MPIRAECPFWKWEKGLEAHCEGGRMDFAVAAERENYLSKFCCNLNGWKCCTVAQNLLKSYEEGNR